MIRLSLLWMFVGVVSVYAWRDWFRGACGLVLLMAVIQHPDMPKTILGIPGLNPWNLALASVTMAWLVGRKREGLEWDLPWRIATMAALYMAVLLIASVRMMLDPAYLDETASYLIGEHFVNVFKWVLPALMLFDGCRSRQRFDLALFSVLALYVLLAVQVIRWVPLGFAVDGATLEARAHKIIGNEIGYHRVNMSMMLAGASWAIFAARVAARRWSTAALMILASFVVLLGQSLTAGRTGYATWAVVGLALCLMRWKRYLVLAPIVATLVLMLVPGVSQRMLQGFSEDTIDTNSRIEQERVEQLDFDSGQDPDLYTVTSGRTFAWPFVVDRIRQNLHVGYGKLAMRRTGLTHMLMETYGENFPHPHNAYLELLLDTGVIGFLLVIPFYGLMLYRSLALFWDSRSPVFIAAGGAAAALTLALLVAAIGSQSFYPREGSVGMWAALALMLRVWIQREHADAAAGSRRDAAQATAQPAALAVARVVTGAPAQFPVLRAASLRREAGAPGRLRRAGIPSVRSIELDQSLWKSPA